MSWTKHGRLELSCTTQGRLELSSTIKCMLYTVIRFVWFSAKFGTGTVESVNGTLVAAKMCIFTLESTDFIFNQCPIYTHDGASAKFSTNSHETVYSVDVLHNTSQVRAVLHNTMHVRSVLHNTLQVRTVPHTTMHVRAILHNTLQVRDVLHNTIQ